MTLYHYFDSPLGQLRLLATDAALIAIEFEGQHSHAAELGRNPILQRCRQQLSEYFDGRRQSFELPLAPQGTEFQRQVWKQLGAIPYATLRSYAEIANACQRPRAVRAVGAANGRNPIPIVIPCHRVIGSDGSLTGYAGGLAAKRLLLELEGISL